MRLEGWRSRPRLVWAVGSVLALVAVAVVVWSLTRAESEEATASDGSTLPSGDAESDIDQLGAQELSDTGKDSTDDGLGASDSDGAGGADSGSPGSGSGGGRPSNRAPIIDSPGLASNGLVLTIEPEASDPDGDDITLLFEIDGTTVDPAHTCSTVGCKGEENPSDHPHSAAVLLDFGDIGYRSDVPVTIIVTDAHGATTRNIYSHTVSARTHVHFQSMTIAIDDPSACFSETEQRVLSYTLELSGAISSDHGSTALAMNASSASGTLVAGPDAHYEGEQPPPLGVLLSVTLSDIGTTGFAAPRSYTSNADETVRVFQNSPCEGAVTYRIMFETS